MTTPESSRGTEGANPTRLHLKVLRGASWSALIKLAGLALTFGFYLVTARVTTPEQYGVFATAFSLATIAGFASTLGQHTSVLRFWPVIEAQLDRKSASGVISRGLRLSLAGGGLVLVLSTLCALLGPSGQSGAAAWTFLAGGLLGCALGVSEFTTAALRAKGSLTFALLPREVLWRLAVIGAISLLPMEHTAASLLLIAAVVLGIAILPQVVALLLELRRSRGPGLPRDVVAQMDHALWGMWGGAVIGPLSALLGTIVTGFALGPTAAGAYFAADRLARLLSIALIGANQIAGPMIARSFHLGRSQDTAAIVSTSTIFSGATAVIGFGAYLLWGRHALELFDPTYAAAIPVLLIISSGQVVNNICGLNGVVLEMAGYERALLRIMLLWTAIGSGAAYFAALLGGIEGAAVGSAIGMIGWNVHASVLCYQRLGIAPLRLKALQQTVRPA